MWKPWLLLGITLLAAGDVPTAPDWLGTGAHLSATAVLAGVTWRLFGLIGDMLKHNDTMRETLAALQTNCAARAAEAAGKRT